jgi:hypothetical protein
VVILSFLYFCPPTESDISAANFISKYKNLEVFYFMGIQEITKVPKSKSKNPFCSATNKWQETNEVIQLTTQNGGKAITDEIPAGGVQKKIAAQEKKVQKYQADLSSSTSSFNAVSSHSESSISSEHSSGETDEKNPLQSSRIPRPTRISDASTSSNTSICSFSSNVSSKSRIPIFIGRENNSLLFSHNLVVNAESESNKVTKIYKINKDKRWVLISPDHRFIGQCRPETTPALTYREKDKIRVINLTKKEITILEEMQMKDNSENSKDIDIRFFGKR